MLSAFFIRIYHSSQLFFWHIDEDIIALTVKRMIVDHHVQLIGFPIPGGIYLGPLFYYLIAIFYFVSKMNPLGLPFFASALGAATTFLVYKVGSIVFENKRIGYFSGIIFGFSYLTNVYSKVFSGLTFAPIYALLVYLFLYRIIKSRKPINLISLGLILILAVQNEGSSISLLFLVLLSLLVFKVKMPKRSLIGLLVAFFIFHLPLLIFDLRHNFFIVRSFFSFFSNHTLQTGRFISLNGLSGVIKLFPVTLSRMIYIPVQGDIGSQILPCLDLAQRRLESVIPYIVFASAFVLLFFAYNSIHKKYLTVGQKIVFLHILILFLGLLSFNIFLNGYLYEWVLVIFFPGFAFIAGYFLDSLWQKKPAGQFFLILFMILFVFFNIRATLTSSGKFGLSDKLYATKWATENVGERAFFLDTLGSCYQNGYIFLFWFYGKQPITTYADDIFTPTFYVKSKTKPTIGVVMVNPSKVEGLEFWKQYAYYKDKIISRKQFENIEILIVDEAR